MTGTQNGQVEGKGARTARRIAIIGAGPGGICTAIRLKEAGYDDIAIFEKSAGVGGTWYNNRYPGLACDVPSHLYSFSFALNPRWSRAYASQPEILTYMEGVVDNYGLHPHIRLSTEVKAAHWDDECTVWRLVLANGAVETFDIVVSAQGMFNLIKWPDIPGLDTFKGTLFHSARWDEGHALAGEKVAVIGSAASAVQFVPCIAREVSELHLYQRAPNWVLPKDDPIFDEQTLAERVSAPHLSRLLRMQIFREMDEFVTWTEQTDVQTEQFRQKCLENLEAVHDPELREKLTPKTSWGCTRPLFSNEYYPTFNRDNVELVTDRIARVTEEGVVDVTGKERKVDTIICATGYHVDRFLSAIEVTGRRGVRIAEAWKEGAEAYLGIAASGFPNLFMIYGPNTNNGSILFMLECQAAYIARRIQWMDTNDVAWIDVRPEIMKSYNKGLIADIDKVSIWRAGCHNYYQADNGRIVTQYPHNMTTYRALTMDPDWGAYTYQHGVAL